MEQNDNSLKSGWKKVGKDFGSLGKDLGKSIAQTTKKAVRAATKWANDDEKETDSKKENSSKKADNAVDDEFIKKEE